MEETPLATLRAERPDLLWIAYAHEGLDGYAYVFPKVGHVNVGIGCLLSHFDKAVDETPYALQAGFVSALVERGVLHGSSDRGCFTPFLIPVGGPLPRSWDGRVLFAGDAGGFVNAITAEGIYYAMVSGELAGRAVAAGASAATTDHVGRAYQRAWQKELGTVLADAVIVQRYLFASHPRVARVIRAAAGMTGVTAQVLEFVQGRLSYASLRRRLLLRFPSTVFRMVRERLAADPPRAC
jgi:flavin-dependent dehydrogenase